MKLKKDYVILTFLLLTWSIYHLQAQGLEYEISIGPQLTKALVLDYKVGLVGNTKPLTNRFPLGYAFAITVRNHAEHFQLGLQLLQDYTKFNSYLSVQWPSDFNAKKSSRWNNYYQAFRFGMGGQIRYSFGKSFAQTGVSYMSVISAKSRSTQYHASDDSVEDTEGEDYSKAGGLLAGVSLGTHFSSKENHSFTISIGLQYSFYKQRYVYETFLQDWTVRPLNCNLMFGYQFIKSGNK